MINNRVIVTPFFLDEPEPELEALAGVDWYLNKPDLPEEDRMVRMSTLHQGIARRFRQHLALIEGELARTGWLAADRPTLVDLYLAACLRWVRLYPSDAPLIVNDDLPPHATALLEALEVRPTIRRAYEAEHMRGQFLTQPSPPDLPVDQVTG